MIYLQVTANRNYQPMKYIYIYRIVIEINILTLINLYSGCLC